MLRTVLIVHAAVAAFLPFAHKSSSISDFMSYDTSHKIEKWQTRNRKNEPMKRLFYRILWRITMSHNIRNRRGFIGSSFMRFASSAIAFRFLWYMCPITSEIVDIWSVRLFCGRIFVSIRLLAIIAGDVVCFSYILLSWVQLSRSYTCIYIGLRLIKSRLIKPIAFWDQFDAERIFLYLFCITNFG